MSKSRSSNDKGRRQRQKTEIKGKAADHRETPGLARKSHALGGMPETEISALKKRLEEDEGLRQKMRAAGDVTEAVAMAKTAGLGVSAQDLIDDGWGEPHKSDNELAVVAGGIANPMGTMVGGDPRTWSPSGRGGTMVGGDPKTWSPSSRDGADPSTWSPEDKRQQ